MITFTGSGVPDDLLDSFNRILMRLLSSGEHLRIGDIVVVHLPDAAGTNITLTDDLRQALNEEIGNYALMLNPPVVTAKKRNKEFLDKLNEKHRRRKMWRK